MEIEKLIIKNVIKKLVSQKVSINKYRR